jgi:hypothetical protein
VPFSYDLQGQRQTYQRAYEGIIPGLQRRYQDTESPGVRELHASSPLPHMPWCAPWPRSLSRDRAGASYQ